jgi:general secretion pathway protein K
MVTGLKMKSRRNGMRAIGNPLSNQRGIALLLTLVILTLLVAVIVEFDYGAKVNLITAGNFRDEVQATYLAQSGVTAARAILKDDTKHPESSKYDALTEFWARPFPPYPVGEGFVSVEITDEAGKIDINRLGAKSSQVRDDTKAMLMRLLGALEIDQSQIEPIVEAIANWVNPDSGHDCPEDSYYQRLNPPYRCKQGPMDALSELYLIKGVTPEVYQKIRPYLTMVSKPTTPININTAALPVLEALDDNITQDTAVCIQEHRPYEALADFFGCATAVGACGLTTPCRRQIGFKSSHFTIKAHGMMHDTEKIVTALLERDKNKLISWQIQ